RAGNAGEPRRNVLGGIPRLVKARARRAGQRMRRGHGAYAPAAVPVGSQPAIRRCHACNPRQAARSGCVSFATDHPYVLTASCPSRMGTTAAITGFLAARRFYLIEMHQFDDTISQRFFVRITFCGVERESVELAQVRQEFQAIATREEMEWRIHDTRERTRVLIMVSNFDHCLEDLLYRHRTGELRMDIT